MDIKRKKLLELFKLTADAFKSEMPDCKKLDYDACLKAYALFTVAQAENCLKDKQQTESAKQLLYQNAYRFGSKLRKSLFVSTWGQTKMVFSLAYRLIGIHISFEKNGQFVVRRCYFSQFYSTEVCELISSLDEGVADGLADGANFSFTQRITQGYDCCTGCFKRR